MSTVKDEVIAMIQQMPEDIDVPDIMAELYFKQKVDAGLKELDEGKGIPHDEVKGRLNKWLK
jgi:predicted transcriptional regulator